jgi:hypothetical protein
METMRQIYFRLALYSFLCYSLGRRPGAEAPMEPESAANLGLKPGVGQWQLVCWALARNDLIML